MKIPITLLKLLSNAEINDFKRIEGIRDSLGLLDEWIKYFNKLIKSKQPVGAKDLEEVEFIHNMINGLKKFKGKVYKKKESRILRTWIPEEMNEIRRIMNEQNNH